MIEQTKKVQAIKIYRIIPVDYDRTKSDLKLITVFIK